MPAVGAAVLLLLVGVASGPADAIETLLVGQHAPADSPTESFAALIAANWIGFAVGAAFAGTLVQHFSFRAGLASGAVAALVAASLAPGAGTAVRRPVAATQGAD